jgi:putative addiction module component (TIGR02574 family)
MSRNEVLAAALALPLDERASLARELIASLDGEPDADAEDAWAVEIERRVQELKDGTVKGIPLAEARAQIDERLRRVRSSR